MPRKLSASEMPNWPAAMQQKMAAAYCGLSVDYFVASCPIEPIKIFKQGEKSTGTKRYIKTALDRWLNSLDHSPKKKRTAVGKVDG